MALEQRVIIRGEDKASAAFRQVEQSAKSLGTKIFEVTTTLSSLVNITTAAVRATTALARSMSEPVRQALEAERAQSLLAAKIRATGSAAGYSVGELNAMASSMAKVTTFGDDAITSAQGLLLQFQNISKSGGVFERTLQLSADLSSAMGIELNDAVQKVARALNEPAERMDALAKIGITFSDAEKSIIESMTAANNVAGAQNAILAKLEATVGGTAKELQGTFGGALVGVRNAWDDLLEEVGRFITNSPAIQGALRKLTDLLHTWGDALQSNSGPMKEFRDWFENMLREAIPGMVRGLSVLVGGMFELGKATVHTAGLLKDAFTAPRTFLADAAAGFVTLEEKLGIISKGEWETRMMEIGKASGYWGESARSAADRVAQGLDRAKGLIQGTLEAAAKNLEATNLTAHANQEAAASSRELTAAMQGESSAARTLAGISAALAKAKSLLAGAAKRIAPEYDATRRRIQEMLGALRPAQGAFNAWTEQWRKLLDVQGGNPLGEQLLALQGFERELRVTVEGVKEWQEATKGTVEAMTPMEEMIARIQEGVQNFKDMILEAADAWREAQDEWNRSVEAFSTTTLDSLRDAFASAAAGLSPLEEALYNWTQTLRQQMATALLDPILGAKGPLAQLFNPVFNVLKQIGASIATNFIQPLISGILSYLGVKTIAEGTAAKAAAAEQIAAISEVTIAQSAAISAMMPALSAAASAALVATLGSAAAAAGALPGILATGAAAGKAIAASMVVPGFAEGGRVTRPTLALVGEDGPETIIPESRGGRARDLLADLFARQPALAPAGAGRGGRPITVQNFVTIQGTPDDPEDVAERIFEAINRRLGESLRGR